MPTRIPTLLLLTLAALASPPAAAEAQQRWLCRYSTRVTDPWTRYLSSYFTVPDGTERWEIQQAFAAHLQQAFGHSLTEHETEQLCYTGTDEETVAGWFQPDYRGKVWWVRRQLDWRYTPGGAGPAREAPAPRPAGEQPPVPEPQQRRDATLQQEMERRAAEVRAKRAALDAELDRRLGRTGAMRDPDAGLRPSPAVASDSPPPAAAPPPEAPRETRHASTDGDANRCVTTVETRLNATFLGNTSASVTNGCGRPVDVRICLMREKKDGTRGWNCGLDLGVDPQEQAVHSSFGATGEIFVDARVTGSDRKLASPPGR